MSITYRIAYGVIVTASFVRLAFDVFWLWLKGLCHTLLKIRRAKNTVSFESLFADIQVRVKKFLLTPSLSFITGYSDQSLLIIRDIVRTFVRQTLLVLRKYFANSISCPIGKCPEATSQELTRLYYLEKSNIVVEELLQLRTLDGRKAKSSAPHRSAYDRTVRNVLHAVSRARRLCSRLSVRGNYGTLLRLIALID